MTWHPYRLLEIYKIGHGGIYIHIHMYIYQISLNMYQNIYQKFFASTRKKWRIHNPHLIHLLPCSFMRPKLLPLHLNLIDCSVPKNEHIFLLYTLRLQLEFLIWFHLHYKPSNHMINIFNILLKKWHMENVKDFHCQRKWNLIGYWPNPLNNTEGSTKLWCQLAT